MNVFAKFDEIPSMLLQDIKETKCYGHTFLRSFVRTDNMKTVYPPTNTVCGGYNQTVMYDKVKATYISIHMSILLLTQSQIHHFP